VQSLQAQRRAGLSRLDLWRGLQALLFAPQFLDRPEVLPVLEALAMEQTAAEHGVLGQLAALLGHDLSAQLHRIPQVRLVLAGELDWLMPKGMQQRLVRALGYGTPQLVEGAGHALWIEQPAALATALRAALPD
jgi:pimeloyl-ACP methyl ester carboxylesterase